MNQLFDGLFEHSTTNACVSDLTPPTFTGVSLLTPQAMGSIKVDYPAATDATPPINYEIYILPGTVSAATLFASTPAIITRALTAYPFLDGNGNFIVKGTTYTVGVRARDAANNLNTNTAVLTTVATGSANLAQIYQDLATAFDATEALLASDVTNLENAISNITFGGSLLSAEIIETVLNASLIETVLTVELIEDVI
jgi:hypothetical protein